MKLSKTLKLFFTSMMTQKNVIKLEDIELILDGALEVGTAVYVESTDDESNLEYVPAPDGEYPYEDKIIKVEAGVIADIKDAEKPEEPASGEPASGEPASGEPATVAAEAEPTEPAKEEPVAESEPSELEAVKADMAELKSKFEELQNNFNTLRDEVNSLLTSPNEESAFSASKPSTDKTISIFKCN